MIQKDIVYTGQLNSKPQFEYHQQSLEYIQRKLGEIPIAKGEIGHVGQEINVDLQKAEVSPKLRIAAGPMGFAPLEEHLSCNPIFFPKTPIF